MQYTLSQLLTVAKNTFNEMFYESSFLFVAEVVKCKQTRKYVYIDCVEYDEGGAVKARCTLCIFQEGLLDTFFQATGLSIQTIVGQNILCTGKLSLYEDHLSIIVSKVHEEYSLGKLQKSQKHILDTLQLEGVLKNNVTTNLGFPPNNIAIISARQADGLEDFYALLRDAQIPYSYTLYDTVVHGNGAKESVHKSLQNIYSDIKHGATFDVICIIRGGGDMAGMLWQNDIDIARGICHMPIPVIVAVGHTNDGTVLDHVCFEVANTPTAAAQYLVNYYINTIGNIKNIYDEIEKKSTQKIVSYKDKISSHYTSILQLHHYTLTHISERINNLFSIISLYHPQNIVNKGYALIRSQDNIISEIMPLIGEKLSIETKKYDIIATVESVATKE